TSGEGHRREMAGARLAVIGSRATTALLAVAAAPAHASATRVTAIETLAAIGDGRAASLAHLLATEPGDDSLAVAAIELLGQVARGKDARATRAFDRLASLVTAADVSTTRRLAGL